MRKFLMFFAGAVCILIASCSKDDRFYPGQDLSTELGKTYPWSSPVFVISPASDNEGDGDFTDELTEAIESARTAGPGSVVKFMPGNYKIGVVELYDFKGSFAGAGPDKTILTMKTPIKLMAQVNDDKCTGWWRVIGGEVNFYGISFVTPDGFLNVGPEDDEPMYKSDLYSIFMINNFNNVFYYPETYQKIKFDKCNFIGGTNTDTSRDGWFVSDLNTLLGIWIGVDYYNMPVPGGLEYPLTKGEYLITNCDFEHFADAAEGFSLGADAVMTVSGCRMNNCLYPLYFTANYNSKVFILNNVFTNSWLMDILIEDNDWGYLGNTLIEPISRCKYTIAGNIFDVPENVSSVVLRDYRAITNPDKYMPVQAVVRNNLFKMSAGSTGISCFNSKDPQLRNNRFTGTGNTGIYVDGQMVYDLWTGTELGMGTAERALVVGNNFTGLSAATADILLGENSRHCMVLGNAGDDVIDNGTSNRIAGLKKWRAGFDFKPHLRPKNHALNRSNMVRFRDF